MILIDVDDFKLVNDRYGHAAGDFVLTTIAQILQAHMRPGDLAARYAGDEFVARLRCEPAVAIERADRIRAAIDNEAIHWDEHSFTVSVSIGIHHHAAHEGLGVKQVMQRVDKAMYKAKHRGRNRVEEFC